MTIQDLTRRLEKASAAQASYSDQAIGLLVCKEALAAAQADTYGVGAVLLDPKGQIIQRGRNKVFAPHFRSDLHAEMVVMNAFEENSPKATNMRDYTLVSSLEPCPMCLSRLLIAGVQTIKYLAADDWGGMVDRRQSLPPAWGRLAEGRSFVLADVSDDLRQIALDLFLLNLDRLRQKLWDR